MIHKLADVQSQHIGDGTRIWQFCVVLPEARIGAGCNVNCNCFIENDVIIGNDVTIKAGVYIWDGVRIEDKAFVGPCVAFSNDLFPRSKNYPDSFSRTVVRKGASIGANSTIVAGVCIGSYALVGAGSVVSRDIPNHAICYGNPARVHGYVCECGTKLGPDYSCKACGRVYGPGENGLVEIGETATGS